MSMSTPNWNGGFGPWGGGGGDPIGDLINTLPPGPGETAARDQGFAGTQGNDPIGDLINSLPTDGSLPTDPCYMPITLTPDECGGGILKPGDRSFEIKPPPTDNHITVPFLPDPAYDTDTGKGRRI